MLFLLKNISNSFYKGIGGVFCDNTPLNPLKIPLTPQDRFFNKVITCLRKLFVIYWGLGV
ncbi:hypothetical protein HPHPH6_0995 [Helicobacter pylori Hp H-6]|uniref:Uncharacterized protein n=1 Tax=Helicobacter pylori Hp H-6 TaxID=992061 RepID=I9UP50_HELPX|nr:hypothetical protein HPHPH6_0995 [Helicobacter pylori Hp H-6]